MNPAVEVLSQDEVDTLLKVGRREIAEFDRLGYELVGGAAAAFQGFKNKALFMIGPARERVAHVYPTRVVTYQAISSGSTEGRALVSVSDYFGGRRPWELLNELPGANARQLDHGHSDALQLVEEAFTPRNFSGDTTIEDLADSVLSAIREFGPVANVDLYPRSVGRLSSDAGSVRRIERWLAWEPPRT